ncbi:MAG: hypothetical protein U9O41_10715 [Candidatus Aerophobetes bacterium]|nr:hypothetical protein [Candidatus Aerophobetes bacterium]
MKDVIFKNEGVIDDTTSLALWFEAIRQANLIEDLNRAIVGCSKDKDGQCRRRGCINNQIAAPIFDRERLLEIKGETLDWLKKHPNFKPEIEKLKGFFHTASLSELGDEIKKVEYITVVNEVEDAFAIIASSFTDSKENEVAMVDAFEDISTSPCPREITADVSKSDKLGNKITYVIVDRFNKVRLIRYIFLNWDYARDNQETIKKIQEESWKKSFSEEKILKRGVKLASIEEHEEKKLNKKK